MAYPIPPWLQAPDTAGQWLAGLHAGASIAGEQARLNQESNSLQAQIAERQNAEQLAAQRTQAQLEMAKAYHDQTTQIRQGQLAAQKQRVDLATSLAANRFAAQQKYQQLVQGGVDPSQALMQLGPQMGMPMSGMATLARGQGQPVWVPPDPNTGAPGYMKTPQGTIHIPPSTHASGELTKRDILRSLEREEGELVKDKVVGMDASKAGSKSLKDEITDKQQRLATIRQKIKDLREGQNVPPGNTGAPVPPNLSGSRTSTAPRSTQAISIIRDSSGRLVVQQQGGQGEPAQQPPQPVKPPPPNITLDAFLKRIKGDRSHFPEDAIETLGHGIAEAVGFPKNHPALRIGGSVFSHDPGTVFSEALLKGKSSKFPGITGKIVWNYLKQLPDAQRNALLAQALQEAGIEEEGKPSVPKPKAAPAQPQEPIAKASGYEYSQFE